jgi:hypothetical protein
MVHSRRKRTGHFWQERFGAVAMDEPHLAGAFRYVTLNPAPARRGPLCGTLAGVERAPTWASAMTA